MSSLLLVCISMDENARMKLLFPDVDVELEEFITTLTLAGKTPTST